MMIKIKGKDIELKFTFNSFKYMSEFNIAEIEEVESKPFKVIQVATILLLGAVNHNPKVRFTEADVEQFLEEYIIDNSIVELLEHLMGELQESSFFKSLQKSQVQKKK